MPEPTVAFIEDVQASGKEIGTILESLEPVLKDVNPQHILIAVLVVALLVTNPDLEPDKIQKGVRDLSHALCLWMAENESGIQVVEGLPKGKMN